MWRMRLAGRSQRRQENAAREADDGFGKSVGNEPIGIYASGEVRGFSATAAGSNRIEGLYFDRTGAVTDVIIRGSTVRVGLSASALLSSTSPINSADSQGAQASRISPEK